MSEWRWWDWAMVAFGVASWFTASFRVTRCTCTRSAPWVFPPRHERHAAMVVRALLLTAYVVPAVAAFDRTGSVCRAR